MLGVHSEEGHNECLIHQDLPVGGTSRRTRIFYWVQGFPHNILKEYIEYFSNNSKVLGNESRITTVIRYKLIKEHF